MDIKKEPASQQEILNALTELVCRLTHTIQIYDGSGDGMQIDPLGSLDMRLYELFTTILECRTFHKSFKIALWDCHRVAEKIPLEYNEEGIIEIPSVIRFMMDLHIKY